MGSTSRAAKTLATLALLLTAALGSQESAGRDRIVVSDPSLSAKLMESAPNMGSRFREGLASALSSQFEVVSHDEVRQAMEDLSITVADLINHDDKAAKLGRHLKARFVLVGRVASLREGGFAINIRILDVPTASHGEWSSATFPKIEQLSTAVNLVLEAAGLLISWKKIDVEEYGALPRHGKLRACRQAYGEVKNDPDLHRAGYKWFVARGEKEWAEKVLDIALEIDPECDWANEGKGRKNLQGIYERIPKDPLLGEHPNEAYESLLILKRNAPKWGSAGEFERAEKCLREVLAHLRSLKNDPLYLDEFVLRRKVRVHPVYGDYLCRCAARRPYLIFVEYTGKGSESRALKAQRILARDVLLLEHLYREFHRLFGKRFGLLFLGERDHREERILKVFVFFDKKAFEDHLEAIEDEDSPPGLGDHYRPSDQWVLLYEGGDDEKIHEKGECDPNTNKVFRAGTRQLMHVYSKIVQQSKGGGYVPWSAAQSKQNWFQVGFADLLGTAKPRKDGKWELMAPNRRLLTEWKNARKKKLPDWPFEKLLSVGSREDMRGEAAMLGGIADIERMSLIFRAQAWSFCHFLWSYRSGRYRDRFLEYMGKELEGSSGPDELEKTLWGGKKASWSALEKEWRSHVNRLWSKMRIG